MELNSMAFRHARTAAFVIFCPCWSHPNPLSINSTCCSASGVNSWKSLPSKTSVFDGVGESLPADRQRMLALLAARVRTSCGRSSSILAPREKGGQRRNGSDEGGNAVRCGVAREHPPCDALCTVAHIAPVPVGNGLGQSPQAPYMYSSSHKACRATLAWRATLHRQA
eukprot:scaffold2173_cov416-Prasinococcus_capsulatus_cf.AAC.8